MADTSGLTLTVDELFADDGETIKEWPEPIVESIDAALLVTVDADVFKTAGEALGVEHQVCKRQVKQNTLSMSSRAS